MDQHYDHCEDKQNKEYVDSLYKVLPNQEALLPNPGQENKSHKAWRSTLMPNSFFFKTFENLFYLPSFMGSSTKGVNTNTDATTSCQQEIYGNGTTVKCHQYAETDPYSIWDKNCIISKFCQK